MQIAATTTALPASRAHGATSARSPRFWVLAVTALFSLIQLLSAPGVFHPDSTQYLVQTYDLLGETR